MSSILKYPYHLIRPVYERTSMHNRVIEEVEDPSLKDAYQHCRNVTREHAKTFYLATRFLPNEKQRGIFAVYALCRYLDDLVDESEDLLLQKKLTHQDISDRLGQWKQELRDTYEGRLQTHPVLMAFSDVLRSYHIPIKLPFQLMEGVSSDLIKYRYNNFEELYDYSYKVASVVGLMTSEIFGYAKPVARKFAVDLGIAMQLTNILRDVGEDLAKNRIYLPADEMRQFGVTEHDLFKNNYTDQYRKFMAFQIERARRYYRRSDYGIPLLSQDSQLPVYLARYNYSRILDRIEQSNYQILNKRVYLNSAEKISIIPRVWWQLRAS